VPATMVSMPTESAIVPAERIERAIVLLRGQKVMLDADLAVLYGVSTNRLGEQVRRNIRRFPADFMFRLTAAEARILRSRFFHLESWERLGHRYYAVVRPAGPTKESPPRQHIISSPQSCTSP
jgi:hypothetical protein